MWAKGAALGNAWRAAPSSRRGFVHECTVVVGIDAKHREGQILARLGDRLDHERLIAYRPTHSVQPLAKSPPVFIPPQCSTMSASKKPGGGLRQSENVRTGTCRRMRPAPSVGTRSGLAQRAVDGRGTDLQQRS